MSCNAIAGCYFLMFIAVSRVIDLELEAYMNG